MSTRFDRLDNTPNRYDNMLASNVYSARRQLASALLAVSVVSNPTVSNLADIISDVFGALRFAVNYHMPPDQMVIGEGCDLEDLPPPGEYEGAGTSASFPNKADERDDTSQPGNPAEWLQAVLDVPDTLKRNLNALGERFDMAIGQLKEYSLNERQRFSSELTGIEFVVYGSENLSIDQEKLDAFFKAMVEFEGYSSPDVTALMSCARELAFAGRQREDKHVGIFLGPPNSRIEGYVITGSSIPIDRQYSRHGGFTFPVGREMRAAVDSFFNVVKPESLEFFEQLDLEVIVIVTPNGGDISDGNRIGGHEIGVHALLQYLIRNSLPQIYLNNDEAVARLVTKEFVRDYMVDDANHFIIENSGPRVAASSRPPGLPPLLFFPDSSGNILAS